MLAIKSLSEYQKMCSRTKTLDNGVSFTIFCGLICSARYFDIFALFLSSFQLVFHFIAMLKSSNNKSQRDIARIYLIFPVKANNNGSKCTYSLDSLAHTERPSLYKNLILLAFHSCNQWYLCSSYKLHAFIFHSEGDFFSFFDFSSFSCLSKPEDRTRGMFARINRKSWHGGWKMFFIL